MSESSRSSRSSSSSSAFSTLVHANRSGKILSSFKASEMIQNILNDACEHIDDRSRNPEDFKLSARHKVELNELITKLSFKRLKKSNIS